VKAGDLVKVKEEPRENEEHEIGIVVGFKPRGWMTPDRRDPDCDVWNDAIVMWPSFGVASHMRALLEVIT
jgi:hypothetical protein